LLITDDFTEAAITTTTTTTTLCLTGTKTAAAAVVTGGARLAARDATRLERPLVCFFLKKFIFTLLMFIDV